MLEFKTVCLWILYKNYYNKKAPENQAPFCAGIMQNIIKIRYVSIILYYSPEIVNVAVAVTVES